MKLISLFSGGKGSFFATKLAKDSGKYSEIELLYTDTLMEDEDLYRFLLETASVILEQPVTGYMLELLSKIPPVWEEENRKVILSKLESEVNNSWQGFTWLSTGENPWDVFISERYLGNSRVDPCSRILKRELSRDYIYQNYEPEDVEVLVGIDWTEIHRFDKAYPLWEPYYLIAPLTEFQGNPKEACDQLLGNLGIAIPKLYQLGFAHNNCGGFCVKAGLGHFKDLATKLPRVYAYHEAKEREFRNKVGNYTILRLQRKPKNIPITLREFLEYKNITIEELEDIGGCGCMI